MPPVEPTASRDELIERHLRIVGPIAGQIAWKRCPRSFGIWAKECDPSISLVGLVYELTGIGNLAQFIAADRYDGDSGYAFSTYANFWVKKLVRLYLEELVSIVPRNDPERRAMDIFDAAIERRRQYRGRAAGGMAIFDGSINIPDSPGDKKIEVVDTDGPTANLGMSYLQRRVGQQLYPWIDMGTHFKPRLHLKGHTNGKASTEPPKDVLDDLDLEKFIDTGPNIFPAEVCYLSRAAGSFNSHESFGKIPAPPKPKPPPRLTAHWRNSLPFAIEYLRRHPHRCEWTTPTLRGSHFVRDPRCLRRKTHDK